MDFLFCDKFEKLWMGWGKKANASEKSIATKKCRRSEIELSAGIKFDSVTPITKTAQGASYGSYKRLKVLTFTWNCVFNLHSCTFLPPASDPIWSSFTWMLFFFLLLLSCVRHDHASLVRFTVKELDYTSNNPKLWMWIFALENIPQCDRGLTQILNLTNIALKSNGFN